MIDGGVVIIIFGAVGMCITPATRTISHRRPPMATPMHDALVAAFAPTSVPHDLDELAALADAALAEDALVRGARDVSAIYDRAAGLASPGAYFGPQIRKDKLP